MAKQDGIAPMVRFSSGEWPSTDAPPPSEEEEEAEEEEEQRKFKCNQCGRGYRHAGSLTNHRRTHEVGSFQCNICGKENWNASAMKNHLRSHASVRRFSCSDCGKCFRLAAQLVTHQRVHLAQSGEDGPLTSALLPEPNKDFVRVEVAAENVPEDVSAASRPFRCDRCEKSYVHQRSLINHQRSHQLGVFECAVCFKLCGNMAALYSHQRTHRARGQETGPDPFSPQNRDAPGNFCHLCEQLFPDSGEFQDHIQMHNSSSRSFSEEVNVYEASFCSAPPSGAGGGQSALDHTGDPPQSAGGAAKAEEAPDERPFRCHTCGKSYRHSGSLINHRRSHQVGAFQCSVCSKTYPHLAALRSHLRLHKTRPPSFRLHSQGDWLSPLDGQLGGVFSPNVHQHSVFGLAQENMADGGAFNDQDEAPRRPHGERATPTHMCADCGETFADIVGIRSHRCPLLQTNSLTFDPGRGQHASEHPEIKQESSHGDLSAAPLNGVGEDDDPDEEDDYQCSACGNSYATMAALRSHLRGHTQAPDAPQSSDPPCRSSHDGPAEMTICSACGETFVSRQDLTAHQLLHAQSEDLEEPSGKSGAADVKEEACIICSSCGISCTSYRQLSSHGCTAGRRVDEEDSKAVGRLQQQETSPNRESAGLEERQFRCDQCGRSYRHAGSLLNHKKSHKTGVFRCGVCQKRFYNLLALKNHQRSHFDVKRHACQECGKAFKVQKQLLNHLRRHKENRAKVQELLQRRGSRADGGAPHPAPGPGEEERPFSCDQCGRTYRHAGSLVNHRKSHKTGEYCCSICRNVYSNQLAMKNHLRSHFAYEKHVCQRCGRGFRRVKQLLAHVCAELRTRQGKMKREDETGLRSRSFRRTDARDGEERPFTCNICQRSYRHAGSLLNHKNTHQTGQFSCSFCSKPFTNRMALRSHTRIHTQRKKHACPTCGKAFRLASLLLSHQRVHSRAPAPLSCSTCGRSFQGRAGLRRHRCLGGQGVNAAAAEGDRCFMCDLCGRSYRHAGSLLNHKRSHSEALHQCSFCLQTFPDPLSLQSHSQVRRHCCPECGKTFCLVAHLQSHMEVHSRNPGVCRESAGPEVVEPARFPDGGAGPQPGDAAAVSEEKSHVCEHCGRAYRHPGSLLNHKNSHKTGCFSCSVCRKEFTNLMALKNHRRIHTEPKRYQCPTCGKAFRVCAQLVCHRRIHTKEKPFSCPLCSRSFSSKSNLRHHQKLHQSHARSPAHTGGAAFSVDADAFTDLDLEFFL